MMTNNIVDIPCREIRSMARQTLRGKWLEAFAVVIVMQVIIMLDNFIPANWPSLARFLLQMAAIVAAGPATYGLELYFIKLFRGQSEGIRTAFEGFDRIMSAFTLYVMISLFTMLWAMLFIIPGIVAAYKYSMAFKIMYDHPEYPPFMCILESKKMMMGNKAKLFRLNLSFIGWGILASAPANYVLRPTVETVVMSVDSLEALIDAAAKFTVPPMVYLALIPVALVQVYIMTANACFYDLAAGNLIVRNEGGVY